MASDSNEINICTAVPGSPTVPLGPKRGQPKGTVLRSSESDTHETWKTRLTNPRPKGTGQTEVQQPNCPDEKILMFNIQNWKV